MLRTKPTGNGVPQLLMLGVLLLLMMQLASAGQGCPFEDGSCRDYCQQQGCNMGYCGHFAWIQCICRKCGDEWNWYDKVRYNPDKEVNQTELDSLKLNASAPLILTNSSADQSRQPEKLTSGLTSGSAKPERKAATLTTLLIPDLSEGGRLDLNDIPDENSDKFLDYLAKNHERLVQATSARVGGQPEPVSEPETEPDEPDEEAIEIHISGRNNDTAQVRADQSALLRALLVRQL